jgi:hypothetical protein
VTEENYDLLAEIRVEGSRIRSSGADTCDVVPFCTISGCSQNGTVFIQCLFIGSATCLGTSVRHHPAVHACDDLVMIETCSRMNCGTLYTTCACICRNIISVRRYSRPIYKILSRVRGSVTNNNGLWIR